MGMMPGASMGMMSTGLPSSMSTPLPSMGASSQAMTSHSMDPYAAAPPPSTQDYPSAQQAAYGTGYSAYQPHMQQSAYGQEDGYDHGAEAAAYQQFSGYAPPPDIMLGGSEVAASAAPQVSLQVRMHPSLLRTSLRTGSQFHSFARLHDIMLEGSGEAASLALQVSLQVPSAHLSALFVFFGEAASVALQVSLQVSPLSSFQCFGFFNFSFWGTHASSPGKSRSRS